MVLFTSTQVSRRLLPRTGTTGQLAVAFALICAGQLWLSCSPADGGYLADVLGPILVTSAGIGLALPAAALAVTHDAAPHQCGIAGGLFATGQQAGSAIGLAVLAAGAAASTAHTGELISGYQLASLAAAILAAVATGTITITTIRGRTRTHPNRQERVHRQCPSWV